MLRLHVLVGVLDFGGTDAPMSDSAIAAIGDNVLHIPTVLGAVVAAYKLLRSGNPSGSRRRSSRISSSAA